MTFKEKLKKWKAKREVSVKQKRKSKRERIGREISYEMGELKEEEKLARAVSKREGIRKQRRVAREKIGSSGGGFAGGLKQIGAGFGKAGSMFDKTVDAFIPQESQKRIRQQGVLGGSMFGGGIDSGSRGGFDPIYGSSAPIRNTRKRRKKKINYSRQIERTALRGAKALLLTGFGLSMIKLTKSGFE